MAEPGIERRGVIFLGVVFTGALGLALWPFVEPKKEIKVSTGPNWEFDPEELRRASEVDAGRLVELASTLKAAVLRLETHAKEQTTAKAGELSAAERRRLREMWWQILEPIVSIDDIKHRYRHWYRVNYVSKPGLHSRAFALGFAGLCAQVESGLVLLETLRGNALLPTLFDEAMPELGLPALTFSTVRARLGRTRDLFYIPVGSEWYDTWMQRHLVKDGKLAALRSLLDDLRKRALARVITPTTSGVANKAGIVKGELFQRWFPLQKGLAEWAGDTRFASQGRRLISDEQLADFKQKLEPGDIILERRNWYLSNVGLPGFWPHAALYTGTQSQIREKIGRDPQVIEKYGDLGAHLAEKYGKAWASLASKDDHGRECVVVEAVSEGVVSASIEHSCAADYVAALRPRIAPLARARAIERALSYWGRPYDFNFDFVTDDQVVCSELVLKAFEADDLGKGLDIPFIEVAGRRAVPPTEFVRVFARELDQPDRKFDFVYFLDGREKDHKAVVADSVALAATPLRPKWDIAQP